MKNTKRSITLKVLLGYLLVAALAALAVWFIYTQVVKFSSLAQSGELNNQQLVLVSEITTELSETENIGRRFIQSGDTTDLNRYSAQIELVQKNLDSLKQTYTDNIMQTELDSISILLSRKSENLKELLNLRSRDRNTSYYREVIQELQKVDASFNENNYERRFSNLEPHQRSVLIRLLEFSKEETPGQLSTLSADSLVIAVKNVLSELEAQNQQFREVINKKEDELLENDMILNEQLRNLLSLIEHQERQNSLARVENSETLLKEVSSIIIFVGIASVLIILFFLFLIVRDVSKSQRYRIQLEEAQSFTESLMKRREQFMATITHDLRSPLNTVIGYTELMGKSNLSNKQNRYLSHLQKSSEYILHLVNDLLDLSKLEAGKMLIEKLPFNPKNLVEETFYNTIPENDKKYLKFNFLAEENTDCQVISDPFRIKQILSNLINNAYKFTDEGEITASLSMRKEIEDSYSLEISIKDTGIGISKTKQEDIFEEFSQEHGEIEKKYGGTGLGLAITKQITDLLKGSIQLKSKPGKGSEFIIIIPVIKLKEAEKLIEIPEISKLNLSGKNILVVDDESSQLALSKELIKSVGMNCDTAADGAEALTKLESRKYDLVLTDIQMPEVDGFQLVKAIKESPKYAQTPVLAVSGRTNVSSNAYSAAGFSGNIIKPYKPSDLLLEIGKILHLELKNNYPHLKKVSLNSSYSLDEIALFAGDDQEALNTILNAFINSTVINLEEIKKAVEYKDPEKAGNIAHRMLPMFKQLKTKGIIEKLQLLEDKQFEKCNFPGLLNEIKSLLQELQKEITV
ncbi:ATP-binding protein [Gillisia sp. Q332]|uniref:hybrid sensor histidine kinase/response regulator n=1 Tax=Gillisia xinjiangensis TaxID=3384765 RepID=UPI00391A2904